MITHNSNFLYLFHIKSDYDLKFTKSAGSEFHSVIDLGVAAALQFSFSLSY